MALLAIDVGNTQTVFGLFEGDELREHWRVATERNRSGDELGALYGSFLDLDGSTESRSPRPSRSCTARTRTSPRSTRRRSCSTSARA